MPFSGLPTGIFWLAWLLALVLLADAARRTNWRAAKHDHLMWAVTTTCILLARQMTVAIPGGLSLQYIGAAWLALLLGYPRAVLSMSAIALVDALQHHQPLGAQALSLLLLGVGPAWLIWLLARGCRRWLPANLFVFLIGPGFLGLFIAYVVPLLAAATLGAMALASEASMADAGHTVDAYWRLILPYALLLAAGEAWLEGMLTTLLVVFVPGAVRLFDERYYLASR